MRVRAQMVERRKEEAHSTAMIERPGPFLRWFCRQFFGPIEFPPAGVERIRGAAARGTVVYVCRTLSYIDYLYFSFAFLRHGLPLSRFANGIRTIFWHPIWKMLAGALHLWR